MIVLDITTFSGHLHPLVVHLPIGFILLGVVFDLAAYTNKYAILKAAVPIALLMGFITAVLACVFGYVLSLSGEYDYSVLRSHQYSGIVLAISLGILYMIRTGSGKKLPGFNSKMFTMVLLGVTMLMTYSGHLGASLTHGHDYLSFQTLTSRLREKPATLDSAMIFEDVVQPIIQNKCLQCHREGKSKGNLSVESLQSLMKGGKNGPAIVAGNSAESELYKRVTLDPDNKDFMPRDGKTPLTRQETRIIKWWIEKAGATSKKRMVELDSTTSIRPQVAAWLGIGGIAEPEQEEGGYSQLINPDIPLVTDTLHISNLRKKGIMVRYMLKKPLMLDVTVPAGSGIKVADFRAVILPLAKNVVWLNLSSNNFTDMDLAFLGIFTNLEKLRLNGNPLTDQVCNQLVALHHLQSVNLNHTRLTANGLATLKSNPAIKNVYTWGTGVGDSEGKLVNKGLSRE